MGGKAKKKGVEKEKVHKRKDFSITRFVSGSWPACAIAGTSNRKIFC
jgi:hypothetical protein